MLHSSDVNNQSHPKFMMMIHEVAAFQWLKKTYLITQCAQIFKIVNRHMIVDGSGVAIQDNTKQIQKFKESSSYAPHIPAVSSSDNFLSWTANTLN